MRIMKITAAVCLAVILALAAVCAAAAGEEAPRILLYTYYEWVGPDGMYLQAGCVDEDGGLWTLERLEPDFDWSAGMLAYLTGKLRDGEMTSAGEVDQDWIDMFELNSLIVCAEDRGNETEAVCEGAGAESSYGVAWDYDGNATEVLLGVSGDSRFENTDPNAQALYKLLRDFFPGVRNYAYSDMGPRGFQPVPLIEFCGWQDIDFSAVAFSCDDIDCEAGPIPVKLTGEDREEILEMITNGVVTGKANATMVTGGTTVYGFLDEDGNWLDSMELYRGLLVTNDGMYYVARAETEEGKDPECGGFRYRVLEDGTAEVLEYLGEELSLVIPDTLDGYIVTSIGDEAFYHYPYSLEEMAIPETVTYIGSRAFALSDLESVEIPAGVTRMGEKNPFGYCDYLETITVAEGNPVFYTQDGVLFCREDHSLVCFPNMLADKEYTVPEGTVKIRGDAFGGVVDLSEIRLPDGLEEIGEQAFGFCWDLESIVIPDSVTEIGDMAFDYCNSLVTVVLPAGLTRIPPMMFNNCDALRNAEIPETVTEIGAGAFFCCISLQEVRVPSGVTEISESAFEACEQLSSVRIGEGVVKIGEGAFQSCYCLSEVWIPDTVTDIGACAFQSCTALHSLTVPGSVAAIGEDAFFNCAKDLTITGDKGSFAEEYCGENGIAFTAR